MLSSLPRQIPALEKDQRLLKGKKVKKISDRNGLIFYRQQSTWLMNDQNALVVKRVRNSRWKVLNHFLITALNRENRKQ